MQSLLIAVLRRFIRFGRLRVDWPDGFSSVFGEGDGREVAMRIATARAVRQLALNPALALGECYMDGTLVPIGCTIREILELMVVNLSAGGAHPGQKLQAAWRKLTRGVSQFNAPRRARRNVAHHYDLDNEFYRLMLDQDMQYSCAYFEQGDESLDQAQAAKKNHIAAKLLLTRPGLRVLDIGCGWGGLALTLARDFGAQVTGITLSKEQLDFARARAEAGGLSDRVRFELRDYRAMGGVFDRVVSVGMLEHVGTPHYRAFFDVVRRCLTEDGVALIHAIGNSYAPAATNAWLDKYIFPGGYSPSLSEIFPHVERARLIVTDLEILRLHYARTLRCWQQRLAARRALIVSTQDERFFRMFEFYLAGCEVAFVHQGEIVFQMQLARRQTALPVTRAYMVDTERALSRLSPSPEAAEAAPVAEAATLDAR